MPAPRPASIDLFAWPAVHDAQLQAEQAHARRVEAARRYRLAPHGEVTSRLRALQEATAAALKADLALQQAIDGAVH